MLLKPSLSYFHVFCSTGSICITGATGSTWSICITGATGLTRSIGSTRSICITGATGLTRSIGLTKTLVVILCIIQHLLSIEALISSIYWNSQLNAPYVDVDIEFKHSKPFFIYCFKRSKSWCRCRIQTF